MVAGIPLLTLATLTIQHALNVTQLLSDLTRKAAGMTKVDIEFLKVFYDVETDAELIGAMNRHIEKLQAKLTRFSPPEPAVTKLREG